MRTWRWRTVADPCAPMRARPGKPPTAVRRIEHPLAERHGQPVREVVRARRGGNALLEFEDGFRVVAPWRAAL